MERGRGGSGEGRGVRQGVRVCVKMKEGDEVRGGDTASEKGCAIWWLVAGG